MPVDSPRRENTFGKAVLTGPADVIHDLVSTVFNDGVTNARGDRIEHFIPRGAFPFALAASSGAFEWEENPIRIGYLIECRRTLGAIAPARAGMLRIPLKLLYLARHLIDIREQPTR